MQVLANNTASIQLFENHTRAHAEHVGRLTVKKIEVRPQKSNLGPYSCEVGALHHNRASYKHSSFCGICQRQCHYEFSTVF